MEILCDMEGLVLHVKSHVEIQDMEIIPDMVLIQDMEIILNIRSRTQYISVAIYCNKRLQ